MITSKSSDKHTFDSAAAFAGAGVMLLLEIVAFILFFLPVFLISLPFMFASRFSSRRAVV